MDTTIRYRASGGWITATIPACAQIAGYGRNEADAKAALLREIAALAARLTTEADEMRELVKELEAA